jgi:hypothetical protein
MAPQMPTKPGSASRVPVDGRKSDAEPHGGVI